MLMKTEVFESRVSLSGSGWLLAVDPENRGDREGWSEAAISEAKHVTVPSVIQEAFPGYHGAAWYWRSIAIPAHANADGRYLLHFGAVDYQARVWLNGSLVGEHEGGETPFVFDVTDLVRAGESNLLSVRVLNITPDGLNGIFLEETAHRCKIMPYQAGAAYNHGGIMDDVELILVPPTYVADIFCVACPAQKCVEAKILVKNTTVALPQVRFDFRVAAAISNGLQKRVTLIQDIPAGETWVKATLPVENPRLWSFRDPYLYRVTVSLRKDDSVEDEASVRVGFRDFRFENGYFRLNGERLYLKCSHTCNHFPIGLQMPHDPDFVRRDILNAKAMGFNMVRFIWGGAMRAQLDFCDEIGMLVYEESYAAFPMRTSAKLSERFRDAVMGVIQRDRNHPSVVVWGILNEVGLSEHFHEAVKILPIIRELDNSRVVFLNSGRFDAQLNIGSFSNPGSSKWEYHLGDESENGPAAKSAIPAEDIVGAGDVHNYPRVPHLPEGIKFLRTLGSQFSKMVWLSEYGIGSGVDLYRTVRHFERLGKSDLEDAQFYRNKLEKFLVDWEDWDLKACFVRPEDFFKESLVKMAGLRKMGLNAVRSNPHLIGHSVTGLIDHGMTGEGLTTPFRELKPGTIDALFEAWMPLQICLFTSRTVLKCGDAVNLEAVLVNEDVLPPGTYAVRLQVVAPEASIMMERLIEVVIGREEEPFACQIFSDTITLPDVPGEYRFLASIEEGAPANGEVKFTVLEARNEAIELPKARLWGVNSSVESWWRQNGFSSNANSNLIVAIGRAVGSSEKALVELAKQVETGATALFLTPDAFKEGWGGVDVSISSTARHQVYSHYTVPNVPKEEERYFLQILWGDFEVRFAGLADDEYTVDLEMCEGWWERPGARLFDVVINGKVFLKDFDVYKESGGRGFALARSCATVPVDGIIAVRFEDRLSGATMSRVRLRDATGTIIAEYSAVGHKGLEAFPWPELGRFAEIQGWLYNRDEWAKTHAIFAGLPAGGLMDYAFYDDLIPDTVFQPIHRPGEAIAGAMKVSQDYSSGLFLCVYPLGKGRIIINTLKVIDHLGSHPAAELLLRNMVNYAATLAGSQRSK